MRAKICLCMIVKNEAHIIRETLDGVINCSDADDVKLTYWVICDTGSTDGTQELIISYFKEKGIPGELKQHAWTGFDHNRTLNFQEAENGNAPKYANYMWVIDADDVPRGKFRLPKKLYADKYNLQYRSGTMSYVRPQLFKIGLKWRYIGVLHEFAESDVKERPSSEDLGGDYYIDSRRLGDRSLNPLKYYKDGMKLYKAYQELQKEIDYYEGTTQLKILEEELEKTTGKARLKELLSKLEEAKGDTRQLNLESEINSLEEKKFLIRFENFVKSSKSKIFDFENSLQELKTSIKNNHSKIQTLSDKADVIFGRHGLKELLRELVDLKKQGKSTVSVEERIREKKEYVKNKENEYQTLKAEIGYQSGSKKRILISKLNKLFDNDICARLEELKCEKKIKDLEIELEKERKQLEYYQQQYDIYASVDNTSKLEELKREYDEHIKYMKSEERPTRIQSLEREIEAHKKTMTDGKDVLNRIHAHKLFMNANDTKKKLQKLKFLATRYTFYMGQSFRDFGDTEYSRKWYHQRGEDVHSQFDEEAYQSRMEVAIIDLNNDEPPEVIEKGFEYASKLYPVAAEPFYKMAVYFNAKEDFERAYKWAKKAHALPFPVDAKMFVQKDIYDFRAAKELAYAAHKLGKYEESFNVAEKALVYNEIPKVEIQFMENIRNMNFKELIKLNTETPPRPPKKGKVKDVTVIMSFINKEKFTGCMNSFLKCCLDTSVVKEWVVYGGTDQTEFMKEYPFVTYMHMTEEIDVLTLSKTKYTVYIDGEWIFLYNSNYILPYLEYMQQEPHIKQIQFVMSRGDNLGNGYNKSVVSLEVPSIMQTETIEETSDAICRRCFSCVKM